MSATLVYAASLRSQDIQKVYHYGMDCKLNDVEIECLVRQHFVSQCYTLDCDVAVPAVQPASATNDCSAGSITDTTTGESCGCVLGAACSNNASGSDGFVWDITYKGLTNLENMSNSSAMNFPYTIDAAGATQLNSDILTWLTHNDISPDLSSTSVFTGPNTINVTITSVYSFVQLILSNDSIGSIKQYLLFTRTC